MNEKTLELMREFTQIIGVSGQETRVCRRFQGEVKDACDEVVFDNLGSVFALKRCGKEHAKKVMICAHMDEVGFVANGFMDDGTIRFIPIGNVDKHVLHRKVRIACDTSEIVGCITSISDKKDEFFVNIGADDKEAVKHMGVKLGDSAVIDGPFEVMNDGLRIMSKAWNDRFGCVMAIELLKELKDVSLEVDLYVGAVVQMEVGNRGATTSTNMIVPDMAIVLDVANVDKDAKDETSGKLGAGVVVKYYDKGMMPNRALLQTYQAICEKHEIPWQSYYNLQTADTAWVHKLQIGCPTLTGAIAIANNYSATQILDYRDYEHVKKALCSLIKELHEESITSFKEENR